MKIHSKLPDAGTTIFTTMSALAKEHNAINLSQGFPDFDCSPRLRELAARYINEGFNQYAPMAGTIQLRETIASIIKTCYGVETHPDTEITVTPGATYGLYTAIASVVNPGDEVLVLEPAYDCYVPAITMHGGIPVFSALDKNDFSVDWNDVRSKLSSRTRCIIINSPHNPSGAILSPQDLDLLAEIVREKEIIVISDEVYEHMVFDGKRHHSILAHEELRQRAFVISSFGKTVHATGWKIGYVTAPAQFTKEFRKVHQFLVFVVNHPFQLALADYLQDQTVYTELRDFYQRKRDKFLELVKTSRFIPLPVRGTYFQLMSCKNITDEAEADFAVRLTKEKKLAAIPLSAFYHDKRDSQILRFCFAKKDETLERAGEIINKI